MTEPAEGMELARLGFREVEAVVCRHCWHHTGEVLTSYPPQLRERCCRCGELQTVVAPRLETDGHGPYLDRPGAPTP